MRLDEAIIILKDVETSIPLHQVEDMRLAVKLGIEALKFLASWNQKQLPQFQIHLPGETE